MPTLTEVLKADPPPGDAAAVAAYLGESVTVQTGDGLVTYRDLAERFGTDAVDAADAVLRQIPGREWVRLALAGAGVDLGAARAKLEIEALRPQLGDALTDGLLSLGSATLPRWQTLGLAAEPTAADVAAARANLAVTDYPLTGVLLSLNAQPTGQVSVSLRVTPAAVGGNGDLLTGDVLAVGFSGDPAGMADARRTLVASVLAAVAVYRQAVGSG